MNVSIRFVAPAVLFAIAGAFACNDPAQTAPPPQYAAGQYPPGQYPPGQYPPQQPGYPQQPYPQQQPGYPPQPAPTAYPPAPAPGPPPAPYPPQPYPPATAPAPGPAPAPAPGPAPFPSPFPTPTAAPSGPSATAIDPTFAAVATGPLFVFAATEAPGMAKEGPLVAGQFQQGQVLETPVNLQTNKCYAVLAVGVGVQEVDITLVLTTSIPNVNPTLARDTGAGTQASLGGKGRCYTWQVPIAAQAKYVIMATKGAGIIAGQAYSK